MVFFLSTRLRFLSDFIKNWLVVIEVKILLLSSLSALTIILLEHILDAFSLIRCFILGSCLSCLTFLAWSGWSSKFALTCSLVKLLDPLIPGPQVLRNISLHSLHFESCFQLSHSLESIKITIQLSLYFIFELNLFKNL
jgi:hypothetical protein